MLKNLIKVGWRALGRSRLYTLVNILSLSAGISCCVLIGLYIANEFSYDRFHKNADRLYRMTAEYTVNGSPERAGMIGSAAGPRLASEFPQIQSYCRLRNFEPYVVQYQDKMFVESPFVFADSTFFTLFSFPLIEGDPHTALQGPNKIVITRSMEKKYFGDEPALGKDLLVGGNQQYVITGVAADPPENSQIEFRFLASFESLPSANSPNWWVNIYATYLLLPDGQQYKALEQNIDRFMRKQDLGQAAGDYLTYHLEPITRVHLYSSLPGLGANGDINTVYILAAVALLILCVACVNYTNLATAQSANRISEIGVRKALGSSKGQLFSQFMGESVLLNLISLIIALGIAAVMLPEFNSLVERQLSISNFFTPAIAFGLLAILLATSLAAGVYPAFVLSRLKVIAILKAGFSFTGGSGSLRKSLIVFQFVISVFLIIATIIIFQQLSFIQNKDLGYDKDHILTFPVDNLVREDFPILKERILQVPGVRAVSCGAQEMTDVSWEDEVSRASDASGQPLFIRALPTDNDFVSAMGVQIVAGSDFTRGDYADTDSSYSRNDNPHTYFLLNESAARALGWTPELAVGQTIFRGGPGGQKGVVKAVLKDFNFLPLHQGVTPLLVFLNPFRQNIFQGFVRISGDNIPQTLAAFEKVWKEDLPHRPFEYHFMDDNFNVVYHNEQQSARIFGVFSFLAILLACLGLFTLTAYSTFQRSKEIGIRKVFGADVAQIVGLITSGFLRLVCIGALIAFPMAWWASKTWLQGFAYHIPIEWWVFLLAGVLTTLIALLTISFQAIRAAAANPVRSLKME